MKKINIIIMCALTVVLLMESSAMKSFAAEKNIPETEVEVLQVTEIEAEPKSNSNARTMMKGCEILVAPMEDGMYVEFYTETVGTSSIIGIKDIKIQRKVWWGWSNVVTSEGGSVENESIYSCSLLYANVGEGNKYRICCTHFGCTDEYEEMEHITDPFTYYLDGIVVN